MPEMDEKEKTHKDFISKGKARFDISPPVMSLTWQIKSTNHNMSFNVDHLLVSS